MNEEKTMKITAQTNQETLLKKCARFFDATQIPVTLIIPDASNDDSGSGDPSCSIIKKTAGINIIKTIPEWACPLSAGFCIECLQRAIALGSKKIQLLMAQGGVAFAVIICEGFRLIVGPVFTVSVGKPPVSIYASSEGQRLCPEIPTEKFISSVTLLCELCTGEPAFVDDIVTTEATLPELYYDTKAENPTDSFGQTYAGLSHSGEGYEQKIYELIEKGDVDGLAATLGSPSNNSIDIMSTDPVRQQKYLFIAFMTIAVRAAIHGGMPSGPAFEVCRRYSLLMDASQSIKEIISYTYNLALSLCRGVRRARGSAGYPHLRKCIDYINTHLHEPVDVGKIAQAGDMSVRNLTKRFRNDTGLSPMAFIEMRRIEEAKYLLRYSDAGIAEIAASLQFCSQSYFTKVFKKHCGMSPGKYRRTAGKSLNITKV